MRSKVFKTLFYLPINYLKFQQTDPKRFKILIAYKTGAKCSKKLEKSVSIHSYIAC